MHPSPTTHRHRPRPVSGPRLRSLLTSVALLSLALGACGDNAVDLASLAEDTFSTESVWRGDERHVTVTITEANLLSILELETYLDELGFSPAVYERMNRTRALDGTQSADSAVADATWTYHPDNGLQVVFDRAEAR